MKLVPEWRAAWRWWSVRLNLIGNMLLAALLAFPAVAHDVWANLPPDLKAMLPPQVVLWVPVLIFIAATFARLVQQGERNEKPD